MSWDVAVWGELELPEGGIARWRAATVDPGAFKDRRSPFKPTRAAASEPVAAVLQRYRQWPPGRIRGEGISIDVGTKTVRFRGLLNEESTQHVLPIAALFRAAGAAGGRGTLSLGGLGIGIGQRISVDRKGSRVELAPELERDPMVAEIAAELARRPPRATAPPARRRAGKSWRGLVPELAAARAEALDRLASADPARLLAAVREADLWLTPSKGLHELRTRDEVLAVLEDPETRADAVNAVRLVGAPLQILSMLDAPGAEDLALRVAASKAPPEVRSPALLALAPSKSDRALDVLVRELERRSDRNAPAWLAAVSALQRMPHAGAGERVAALLTPSVFETPDRLGVILAVLGARRHRPILPALAKPFRSGSAAVRDAAADAIVKVATDAELEKATGLSREAFLAKWAHHGWLRAPAKQVKTWVSKLLGSAAQ